MSVHQVNEHKRAKRQPKLNLYGKGIYKQPSGHLRYHSPKHLRGQMVHRKVIADMIEETPYSIKLMLPWPYEVHHQDYNKEHNCGPNLLIVSESFHSIMTASGARRDGGLFAKKYEPKWKPAPQYVLDFQKQMDEEVPF